MKSTQHRPMMAALRNLADELQQIEVKSHRENQLVRDAAELLRVQARMLRGDPLIKAFGAVGDWGYESEIGRALLVLRANTCAARRDSPANNAAASTDAPPAWLMALCVISSEIAAGRFLLPYTIENIDERRVLCIRISHVVVHIARNASALNLMMGVPLPSDIMLKKQLRRTGVLLTNEGGQSPQPLERTFGGERVSNMVGILLDDVCGAADDFGLPITAPFRAQ